ncbi:hypothetical protein GCM10022237_45050 [Nocardioides ginsengisoli]|uniref:DUF2877 domain-containing protein n=1 Tax=Nocardioides ginsengisoli TaxID=363868 RepID=A0ABW3W5R4_9ACTN
MPDPSSSSPLPSGRVAGAGGTALRTLLDGPAASGTVVHAGAQAVYADLGGRVVGVLARGAVHVPCAIATTLPSLPEITVGAPVTAAGGMLTVGAMSVGVDRLVGFALPALDAAATERLRVLDPDLSPARDQLPVSALERLAAGDPDAVPALVGRGDGLTPVGDDVLAGWLVTARATGRDHAPVTAAVRAHLHRTTSLSATLLLHAADGEAIAPFRTAVASGDADAVAGLLAVGHTSGAGMLLGATLALLQSHSEPLEGSPR